MLSEAISEWPLLDNTIASLPPLFFRAVWKAVLLKEYQQEPVSRFLEEEILLLATRYFQFKGKDIVQDAQLKAGWDTLCRVYEEDIRSPRIAGFASWDGWVNRVEFDGFVFRALNSPAELHEEGEGMRNCIADYAKRCRLGEYRVYAVGEKKSGDRVATMTVEMDENSAWRLDQVHGPLNAPVSDQLVLAADAVCRSLNDLGRWSPRCRRKMGQAMQRRVF